MRIPKKYYLLFIGALPLLLMGVLWNSGKDEVIDINVHDTYFVFLSSHFSVLLSVIFALLGLFYLICDKLNFKLNHSLSKIHINITVLSIPAYFIGIPLLIAKSKGRYEVAFQDLPDENTLITIIFLLVITAQLLLLVNIIISLIRHALQRTASK